MAGGPRRSFTNFTIGNGHSFGGEYIGLVPKERLCYTDRFDDPNLPGEIRVTVSLKAVSERYRRPAASYAPTRERTAATSRTGRTSMQP